MSAFYLSNVEQYLNMDGIWMDFCRNASRAADRREQPVHPLVSRRRRPGFGGGASLNQGIYPMITDLKLCAGQ